MRSTKRSNRHERTHGSSHESLVREVTRTYARKEELRTLIGRSTQLELSYTSTPRAGAHANKREKVYAIWQTMHQAGRFCFEFQCFEFNLREKSNDASLVCRCAPSNILRSCQPRTTHCKLCHVGYHVALYHRSALKPTRIPTLSRRVPRKIAWRHSKTSASGWMLPRNRSRTIWTRSETRFLDSSLSRTMSCSPFWDPATPPLSR